MHESADSDIYGRAYHDGEDGFRLVIVEGNQTHDWGAHIPDHDEFEIPGGVLIPTDDGDLSSVYRYVSNERSVDKFVTRNGLGRLEARVGILRIAFCASVEEVEDRTGMPAVCVDTVVDAAEDGLRNDSVLVDIEDAR